jgi:mono/diheme cytochrome c family protein
MKHSIVLPIALTGLAITLTGVLFAQPKTAPQTPAPSVNAPPNGASKAQVDHGRYLVELGDCVACHTTQGGQRFAGGRTVETPFGKLLSANITPDPQTGIGQYTADDFYRALHEGVDREGHHLYPAFPYNYYTKIAREDSDAMYAYIRTIPAVKNELHSNQLPFPFNIRALMVVWNWMFFDKGEYRADNSKPPQWNRGAYLVEGLGHCEACHTPKNILGGPKVNNAFHGGRFGEWFAPDLTRNQRVGLGAWKDPALREFLRKGVNEHSAASGEMGEVVAFSTSQMSDADLDAVVSYLRTVPASPDAKVQAPDAKLMKAGESIWQDSCSACHRMDAGGVPRFFPPLQHDPNVQQTDPTTLIHFVLAGTRKVPTDNAPTPLAMPAYEWKLSDDQIAAVLTYVRNSWGNVAQPVQAQEVAEVRKKLNLQLHLPATQPPVNLTHPGPESLGKANTDSRENGTARAGQAAPANLRIDTAASASGKGGAGANDTSKSGGSSAPKQQGGGHPAGVPATGPG